MSWIRSFRDLNRDQGNDRERQRLIRSNNLQKYPILGESPELGTSQQARKESFLDMLRLFFCPSFTIKSFVFTITCVQIFIYFLTVVCYYNSNAFLKPSSESLDLFGEKNTDKMKNHYELWRFLTPVFLHANLTHLIFNMLMQVIIGFRVEATVGLWKTIIVYFGSGIGGILVSSLFSPLSLAVGASTAIFGLTTAILAWIVLNWTSLEGNPNRINSLIWVIILIVINLVMPSSSTDSFGHIGGALFGLLISFLIFDTINSPTKNENLIKKCAGIILLFFSIGGFITFFTLIETN
ncbi:unnamed protein product [Blepharisma stoltei]|uniref:Rhomboid-like protease n=1 Tax=Blepharisma stoltei TaxID=1481888 RepID=A0AAU9JQR9_9CILI|nr:unnamed protein product [Blepharisma stoltei]